MLGGLLWIFDLYLYLATGVDTMSGHLRNEGDGGGVGAGVCCGVLVLFAFWVASTTVDDRSNS